MRLRLGSIAAGCAALLSAHCSLLAPTDDELRGLGAEPPGGDPVYHDLTTASFWSTFDTTSAFTLARDFAGGTFDGRYVYLVPRVGGVVARYDTTGDFATHSSWSVFDTAALDPNATGFAGAVFDGQFVYLVPSNYNSGWLVVRYDTRASFGAAASWKTFDTRSVNPGAEQFFGGVFDGRFVYFAPYRNAFSNSDGIVARYDTMGAFDTAASWTSIDIAPLSSGKGAGGFHGAAFDGRFVYFVQNENSGSPDGFVARYDRQGDFAASASWSFIDLREMNSGAVTFFGAAFDGCFLYAVPNHAGAPSILGRLDTSGSFTASWSLLDTTTIAPGLSGFAGAAFDGRFLYLVPHDNGAADGLVTRFDTTSSELDTPASWSSFDTTSVNAAAKGFMGALFDGRFLYLLPSSGGVVARFDAKTPPSLPPLPAFHGSFL